MSTADVAELARDVSRLEDLRCVKDLQRTYAQLCQSGRWREATELFAPDATLEWGSTRMQGRERIGRWLAQRTAGARSSGGLYTEIIDAPVVHLFPDGERASGRWSAMVFTGDGAGTAHVDGGLYENTYERRDGCWRIASVRFHPQFAGDDLHGWTNVDSAPLPVIPTHFGAYDAGMPVLRPVGEPAEPALSDGELAARIARLNAEDAARNLVHAYGYYRDRRMWDDVVDLFTDDATARFTADRFYGPEGVRTAHERFGPMGLEWGEAGERALFDVTIRIGDDGTATCRGIQLGIDADVGSGTAAWEFAAITAHLAVGDDGLWRIRAWECDVLLRADYATGWSRGGSVASRPAASVDPDVQWRSRPPVCGPAVADEGDLERRLRRSAAYDGVENVSAAYGFFLDDFRWSDMAALFARSGHKQSAFAGYSIGREAILGTAIACYGPTRAAREALSFHWRTQPVIHVSHDGRSAHLRTRLFQPRTAVRPEATPKDFYMGGLHSGMYPNDQAVLEDGRWHLWSLAVDEHYVAMQSWRAGFAGVKPRPEGEAPRPSIVLTAYPPEILLRDIVVREEGFRGGAGRLVEWPDILPMWFHYRNPVSGRVPERFWPDCVPCEVAPHTRMTAHGYQHPPNGPELDGRELDRTH